MAPMLCHQATGLPFGVASLLAGVTATSGVTIASGVTAWSGRVFKL